MKAWLVNEKEERISAVVFAETAGKARALAQYTEVCEDCDFCDIQVRRLPQIDKYYKDGKTEMDWNNPKDRIALVKECGFQCEIIMDECNECPAKKFCGTYSES